MTVPGASSSHDPAGDQLWLELPPISRTAPARLLVMLHDAGMSPEAFAPVAIAWQLKFPGATAVLMQGPIRSTGGPCWYDPGVPDAHRERQLREARSQLMAQIATVQSSLGISATQTVIVGHGQGATLALELACVRAESAIEGAAPVAEAAPAPGGAMDCGPVLAAIVVAYGGRLARAMRPGDRVAPLTVHLIHGEFDSIVPATHAWRAHRDLTALGSDVTLDVVEDEAHAIGQDLVNLGTTRVMQTLFRGRRARGKTPLH